MLHRRIAEEQPPVRDGGFVYPSIAGDVVEFRDDNRKVFAAYHFRDPFKSFFRGLLTPNGCDVVCPPPQDHPHHKGLQYGLCADDVNFWEEQDPDHPSRRIGRQVTETLKLRPPGHGAGFVQDLVWRDAVCVSFKETRTISVERLTQPAYSWTWRTTITAERDLRLIKSAWSEGPGQRGYCGLGLRLAPDLFNKSSLVPPLPSDMPETPKTVTFHGRGVNVTFAQDTTRQQDAVFVSPSELNQLDFTFMSLGPTNIAPRRLKTGERLEREYTVTVADA
jgi:hypothetical protein